MIEYDHNRSNVIKCGLGVTYHLTSALDQRNIVLLRPKDSLGEEAPLEQLDHDEDVIVQRWNKIYLFLPFSKMSSFNHRSNKIIE